MPHGLDEAFENVRQFHKVFDHPCPETPQMQPPERAATRSRWVESEMSELRDATTLVDQADAYLDGLYFCMGGLVELGLSPGPIWSIIHEANMSKRNADGTVTKDANGKVQKPASWTPPEPLIKAEIERQIRATQPINQFKSPD